MTDNVKNTIITMMILGTLGFILKKSRVTDKRTDKFLSQLLVNFCTPAVMIYINLTNFSIATFRNSYRSILIAILTMIFMNVIAYGVSKALSLRGMEQGEFISMATFSNTIFVGLPLITGIFGERAVPYLMLYFIGNTLTFWTLGIYQLVRSSGKAFSSRNLLKIINPPIVGFAVGIALLYYNVNLPTYAMDSIYYLRILMTPLSLLFMGSVIGDLKMSSVGSPVTTVLILLLRFVLAPISCLLLLKAFNMPEDLTKVFIVCAGLPVMTNISIAVGKYGGNPSYSSFMTALTSIAFIFVMPFYFELFAFI
ncbi:AEC family transporter [Proteiniclasticum sp. SCR006]|uniref:AEC family transporter n=1 Tax=Proteiniclasticum aestuarii TaxID=2817862 RepID=A0A939HAI1_9CLOT|nr:AEC family transporter [Proteiniclasticum aestuarii]MBO1264397.1 AEC family transporter [Proteiniclasticum aestuarii]